MKKAIMLVLVLLALLMTLPALAEETVDIPVYLQWVDSNNSAYRPSNPYTPQVKLYAGNNLVGTTDQTFSYYEYAYGESDTVYVNNQFKNLPKYDSNGGEIAYRIEAPEFMYYDLEVIARSDGSFLIQYTLNFGTVDIPVRIVWDDENDKDGLRPTSLKVIAEADLTGDWYYEEQTIRKEDDWLYTFRDMNQQEEWTGRFLTYMISLQTPSGYFAERTGSQSEGYVYTLTHCPAIEIPVKIIWDDQNDLQGKRPDDVWVYLEANYSDWTDSWASEIWLNADRNWAGKFLYSPEYGRPISYSVDPDDVRDYSTTITEENGGFVITYSYEPWPRTEIPAKIVWNDNNDSAGARPDEVTLYLQKSYEDGDDTYWDEYEEGTFSAESNWERTFVIVSATSSSNKNYRVSAHDIEDYSKTVTNENGKWVVTYTYAPTPKKLVPVEAVWDHKNNPREEWPDEAEIELWIYYVEGEETSKFASIYAESGWKHTFRVSIDPDYNVSPTFELLPHSVPDYTWSEPVEKDGGFVVTYTYNPAPKTRIPVEIVWDDGDDRDGIRPEEVWVDLYVQVDEMDSIFTEYVKSSTLSAEDNWKRTIVFTTISTYIEDTYTVDHEQVTGYESNCVKKDGGFVITFTHKPIRSPENPPAPPVPPAAGGTVDNFSAPPKTGDASRLMLWSSLLVVSAAALAGCILLPRKKRDA